MLKAILFISVFFTLISPSLFPTNEVNSCQGKICSSKNSVQGSEFIPERIIPMKLKYAVHANVSGSTFEYAINRNIKSVLYKQNRTYKIVTVTNNPAGKTVDTFYIDKNTLSPLKRVIDQGIYDIDLDYCNTQISGTIKAGGKTHKIDKIIQKPVIADGSGMDIVIATLPLKLDYSIQFQLFEFQSNELKILELKVLDKAVIKIGEKSFEAFKVILTPAGSKEILMTIYLSCKKPFIMLKSELSYSTSTGYGKVLTELVGYQF